MKKQMLKIILSSILTLMIFGGCGGGGDDTVVGTVGDAKIYARDLNEIFGRTRQNFLTFEDEFTARRNILDSLVIQQILVAEAYKKNIDESEEIKRIILANQDKFLLDVLYKKMVIDPVSVTEDDIKDYYSKLEHKVQASHILVLTEDTAIMLLDSLKNGANFENLAVNFSIDPTAGTNRGDLGYFIWGQMDPTFQDNVFKMQPGEISEPFKTRYGWHIVKMVDRAENELRSTYKKMRDQIKVSTEGARKKENLENYSTVIKDKYPIRVDSITCDYLMHKRSTLYPPALLETLPKNDFNVKELDRDEKELIMATWESGQMTVGQYLAQRRQLGNNAPDLDNYEGLALVIFQLNFMSILGTEARQSGMQDDEEYKRRIRKFKELAMADVMQIDSIVYPGEPDEGEVRSYYDSHQEDFLIPARIHVYEIMFNDHSTAKSYTGKIKTLKKFKSLAAELTERTGKRLVEGDLSYIDIRSYPRLFALAENIPVGQVGGPIQIGNKYSIIFVADKKIEQTKDFLVVKSQIKDILERKLKEDAFGSWVEKKRSEVDIKIYENNIRAGIDKTRYETEVEPSS